MENKEEHELHSSKPHMKNEEQELNTSNTNTNNKEQTLNASNPNEKSEEQKINTSDPNKKNEEQELNTSNPNENNEEHTLRASNQNKKNEEHVYLPMTSLRMRGEEQLHPINKLATDVQSRVNNDSRSDGIYVTATEGINFPKRNTFQSKELETDVQSRVNKDSGYDCTYMSIPDVQSRVNKDSNYDCTNMPITEETSFHNRNAFQSKKLATDVERIEPIYVTNAFIWKTRNANALKKNTFPSEELTSDVQEPANSNRTTLGSLNLRAKNRTFASDHKIKDVIYLNSEGCPKTVDFYLNEFRIYLKDQNNLCNTYTIPLGVISRIELDESVISCYNYAKIKCKDFRQINLQYERTEYNTKIMKDIRKYSFTLSYKPFIAYNVREIIPSYPNIGWFLYNAEEEYNSMGIPNEFWKITDINKDYEFCKTYPSIFAVPVNTTNTELFSIRDFRDKGRIPVLSWIHPKNGNTLTRSSQPLNGIFTNSKLLKTDANYLLKILNSSTKLGKTLYIFDARSKSDANIDQLKGGGYENTKNYLFNMELKFLDLPDILSINDSLFKFRKFISKSDGPSPNIEHLEWYKYVHEFLTEAKDIANCIHFIDSVLVQCNHGWDKTPLLVSLAMLLLDPFYRTIKGFLILIEKEWLSFGHPFEKRVGHGIEEYNYEERSDVFLLFIDCVWQILVNYSKFFEFRESMLHNILTHLYSCYFGTFLYNSEFERKLHDVKTETTSLWSFINNQRHLYLNNSFVRADLCKSFEVQKCSYWFSYYEHWKM